MMPEPQTPVTPKFAVASAKPGSSDQRSQPITLKRGSSVVRSMRTRSIAPGAARWPQEICAPFEGGAGRRGAGEQPLAVAEHDFRIGADVDQEPQFVAEIGRLGEHDAGRVGADMAGDAGQRIDKGAGRDVEPDFSGARLIGAVDASARTARRRARSDRGRERGDA